MSWYTIFYLIAIIDNFKHIVGIVLLISFLLTIAFLIVHLVNGHELSETSDRNAHYKRRLFWKTISKKIVKISLTLTIIFGLFHIFTPTKGGIMLIISGGAIGEFVTSNEDTKEIPAEMAEWFRMEIQKEIRSLKDAPITEEIKSMTKDQLREELIEIKTE